ncbi:flagellar hook-basal body complex protein [Stappia sp. F7233]|uniref:Flagellar hook protein FlgE n=1 Tax=Stappia albiluteola TaxID=2758565 RepID=A0A839AFM8_9HYPH|nr:flagellar hook-basal body complex protein [Stappia albiluteola]MBA5778451.1 flagellar hook-basal body complex protein [Stappia albiluteola]
MGVFGALNAAVSGLTAQAYALENISGNIANSSTFGYKRLDTSFSDFVSGGGGPQSGQVAGGVAARSRATNNVAGDYLPFNDQDTFISINGSGYFVVTERIGDNGGQPIFSSRNFYTRAGDFEKDSAGRLVNGSGYYLLGRPIDPVTRSVSGSAPEIIKIDNSLIPAVRTNRITFNRGALPTSFDDGQGGNVNGPLSQTLTTQAGAGSPFALGTRLGLNQITNADVGTFLDTSIGGGAITGFTAVGEPVNVQLQWAKSDDGDPTAKIYGTADLSSFPGADTFEGSVLTLRSGGSVSSYVFDGTADQAQRFNDNLATAGYRAEIVDGKLKVSRADGADFSLGVNDNALATALGITGATQGSPQNVSSGGGSPSTVTGGQDLAAGASLASFAGETITLRVGGADTTFQIGSQTSVGDLVAGLNGNGGFTAQLTGSPARLQISRADGAAFDIFASNSALATALGFTATAGTTLASAPPTQDTWGLYYNSNTNPQSPSAVAWQKLGDFQFDKESGALIYPVPSVLTIQDLAVNGRSLGEVIFEIPADALKQQNVPGSGFQYDQNGFAAGEVTRTEISDSGRLVAIYSNGRQRDLYEIPVVTFAGEAELSRRDGGVFSETTESGQPIYAGGGTINGGSVEGSNVDIADEFSKLIVTQQAYSANTRIITTADELLQESINIIR